MFDKNNMKFIDIQLQKLVNMNNPDCVFNEVKIIISLIFKDFDCKLLDDTYCDIIKLFNGRYPGYQKCNTRYHDLKHTTDALLAMIRLMHGAILSGEFISKKSLSLALISTLLHDVGYIQTIDDNKGTGAKYTRIHIKRSIEFMGKYFIKNNIPQADYKNCADMLECTGFAINIAEIKFVSKEIELLGKMLGTADLLGQLSDRIYIEKLLFLFREYQEGNIPGYKSELDLLKKTVNFYLTTDQRLDSELGGLQKYTRYHFKKRWDIDRDLYEGAIERNKNYLHYILTNHEKEYRDYLRRSCIVKDLDKEMLKSNL